MPDGTLMQFFFDIGEVQKRINSTKQVPITTAGLPNYYEFNATFAEGYDIMYPTVIVDMNDIFTSGLDSSKMNILCGGGYAIDALYPYHGASRRGYFIRDVKFVAGLCYIDLQFDAAAYYADDIKNSTQYVVDSTILDTSLEQSYPTEWERVRVRSVAEDNIFPLPAFSPGSYVIGTAGVGGIVYYLLTHDAFTNLTKLIFATPQDTLWESLVGATVTSITRTFLNPMDFLLSAVFIPILPGQYDSEDIYLGYWNTGVKGKRISVGEPVKVFDGSVAIPLNPQYADSVSVPFVQSPTYSEYELIIPCCGSVPILAGISTTERVESIYYSGAIDYMGNISVAYRYLPSSTGDYDGLVSGFCGSAVPMSSSSGMIVMQKSETTGSASANFLEARLQQRVEIIGTFRRAKVPGGVPGGAYRGRRKLNANGWYRTENASVDWNCDSEVKSILETMMNTGIYIE